MGLLSQAHSYLIRALFGVFITFLGLKGIYDAQVNYQLVEQTFDVLEATLKFDMQGIKKYSVEILFFQNFLFIFGGLLIVFGFYLRKFVTITGIILFMFLIKNPFLYKDRAYCAVIKMISFIGGVCFT